MRAGTADVEQSTSEKRRWVCYYCILKTKTVTPYSCAEEGLQNAKSHLWLQHKIWNETEKGPKPTKAGWRNKVPQGNRNIAEAWGLDTTNPREQQIANNYLSGFDKAIFQQKFLRTIVVHNLPFSLADSILLRDVFEYCNPLISRTQAHMSRKTTHSRVLTAYNAHKPKVMEILQRVRGKIHAAFDGWLSNNKKSLYGVVVFYLDENDRPKKLVLGLPEVKEAHTGENIAIHMHDVFEAFGIKDKMGYFTLDNASMLFFVISIFYCSNLAILIRYIFV
jgi:hypothetical protein